MGGAAEPAPVRGVIHQVGPMPDGNERPRLHRLKVEGFRSIAQLEITFSNLDVMIGPNGAGKSNLIGFLRLLGFMLSSDTGLGLFVGRSGGAAALLHDGPKISQEIAAEIVIETSAGTNEYVFRLQVAAGDTLVFAEEKFRFRQRGRSTAQTWLAFGAGHRSPGILGVSEDNRRRTQRTVLSLLRGLSVYQFHDTSAEAPPKRKSRIDAGRFLRGDAGNLASFLFNMRDAQPGYYERIVKTIRLIAPFFDDFDLEEDEGYTLLRWREVGSDELFGPSQISDGTLRAMALVTLLLQPPTSMPPMLVIDEPELGLHPVGLQIVSGLVRAASQSRQCLIATQASAFLDALDPENVIVVERRGRSSTFTRLEAASLKTWLDEYDLAELWDMNLLGGRPASLAAE